MWIFCLVKKKVKKGLLTVTCHLGRKRWTQIDPRRENCQILVATDRKIAGFHLQNSARYTHEWHNRQRWIKLISCFSFTWLLVNHGWIKIELHDVENASKSPFILCGGSVLERQRENRARFVPLHFTLLFTYKARFRTQWAFKGSVHTLGLQSQLDRRTMHSWKGRHNQPKAWVNSTVFSCLLKTSVFCCILRVGVSAEFRSFGP